MTETRAFLVDVLSFSSALPERSETLSSSGASTESFILHPEIHKAAIAAARSIAIDLILVFIAYHSVLLSGAASSGSISALFGRINSSSGFLTLTFVPFETELTINALPPIVTPSPITVSPPSTDVPE